MSSHKAPPGRRRIAIVTPELLGFFQNGGIGTCYSNLAGLLAENGHDVHVILVEHMLHSKPPSDNHARIVESYENRNIHIHPIEVPGSVISFHSFPHSICTAAHRVCTLLRELSVIAPFDLVHLSDGYGFGLHCLQLKHCGIAFQTTRFVIGLHSPTLWVDEANHINMLSAATLTRDLMERQSVELADALWSPSRYLLDWITERGWKLPEHTWVYPYPTVLQRHEFATKGESPDPGPVVLGQKSLVFFGRLEPRKGLYIFLEGLPHLSRMLTKAKMPLPHIVFLGKSMGLISGDGTGKDAEEYILGSMEKTAFSFEIMAGMGHEQALRFLSGPGQIAVMPATIDNSPNTVYECLNYSIPFVASRTGGIPELVHPSDVDRATFPHADAHRPFMQASHLLAEKLFDALSAPCFSPVRPATDRAEIWRTWSGWHAAIPTANESPLVQNITEFPAAESLAICMTTIGRNVGFLSEAIDALRAQTRQGFHFVLINDGGTDPGFLDFCASQTTDFAARKWRIIHQDNQFVGKARNNAARSLSSKLLLFKDDDNLPRPFEVETFLSAFAATDAAIHTCGLRYIDMDGNPLHLEDGGEALFIPPGSDALVGLMDNCFGDLNFMVRRTDFEALGGFSEGCSAGFSDWELLAKACLQGISICVIPEVLFDYRVVEKSLSKNSDLSESGRKLLCSAYGKFMPDSLKLLPQVLHYAIRDLGGGTSGTFQQLSQNLEKFKNWSEQVIGYYKPRSEYFEERCKWFEERCKWFEERCKWLEERAEHFEKQFNQLNES